MPGAAADVTAAALVATTVGTAPDAAAAAATVTPTEAVAPADGRVLFVAAGAAVAAWEAGPATAAGATAGAPDPDDTDTDCGAWERAGTTGPAAGAAGVGAAAGAAGVGAAGGMNRSSQPRVTFWDGLTHKHKRERVGNKGQPHKPYRRHCSTVEGVTQLEASQPRERALEGRGGAGVGEWKATC